MLKSSKMRYQFPQMSSMPFGFGMPNPFSQEFYDSHIFSGDKMKDSKNSGSKAGDTSNKTEAKHKSKAKLAF